MAPDPHSLSGNAGADNIQKTSVQILQTTMRIWHDYPELSKYLEEMTITIPNLNDPVISSRVLGEYEHSLQVLVQKYAGAAVKKGNPSEVD